MSRALSPVLHDQSFDPFLFAVIGEERNGMLLSMLSALARLGLDPWFEATKLSRLPAPAATERLTSLLSSLPVAQLKAPAPVTVTGWIALLPHPVPDAVRSPRGAVVKESKPTWPGVAVILAVFLMMLAAQFADWRKPLQPSGGGASPAISGSR